MGSSGSPRLSLLKAVSCSSPSSATSFSCLRRTLSRFENPMKKQTLVLKDCCFLSGFELLVSGFGH